MEKKIFILAGLAALTGGISACLLKKNSKTREKEVERTSVEDDNNQLVLSYDQIIERLGRYRYSQFEGNDNAIFVSAYLDYLPQPKDFFEEYYLFNINTFGSSVSISIISGTHKNGIITQDEVLYFNRGNYSYYPRFRVEKENKEYLETLTISSKKLQEMENGGYYFGNCIWQGIEREYDYGWYRSLENTKENDMIHMKKGGPVEVRALVSKTVFNKLKTLHGNLYDMPANQFLDQLDKIFEEEIVRPRTKQEIEG